MPPSGPFSTSPSPPPSPPPPAGTCAGAEADGGLAPGLLAVKCLKVFQASRPRIAMVIGDMPPEDCELGVLEPRGPCCMPLMTSSKPIAASLSPAAKDILMAHDGYKAVPTGGASWEAQHEPATDSLRCGGTTDVSRGRTGRCSAADSGALAGL